METTKLQFFLGANTQDGFCSRFDELRNLKNYRHQYIIKGSPGCGKSTFMRRIAQAAEERGCQVERIFCSSDADSLDGVIVHDLGISFADGTAPHVVEPRYAGARESYIDFSSFWNETGLMSVRNEIAAIDAKIKACYRNAYGHLRCAGIYDSLLVGMADVRRESDLCRRITGLCRREFPKRGTGTAGRRYTRYLCGYTPTGYLTYTDTVSGMCDRVIALTDNFGLAADALARISDAAVQAGFDVYECLDPLYTAKRIEHLLIPSLRLGFVSEEKGDTRFSPDKRINLDPYVLESLSEDDIRYAKVLRKRKHEAVDAGIAQIAAAKTYHDELETQYHPHIDFEKLGAFTQAWLEKLGLNS